MEAKQIRKHVALIESVMDEPVEEDIAGLAMQAGTMAASGIASRIIGASLAKMLGGWLAKQSPDAQKTAQANLQQIEGNPQASAKLKQSVIRAAKMKSAKTLYWLLKT